MSSQHPMSLAREYAMQFMYQCELEQVYYYSEAHFDHFRAQYTAAPKSAQLCRDLVEGALNNMSVLDEHIRSVAENWNLERMAATDRSVLRVACYELLNGEAPPRVVMNEAIELAKKYGTENSGSFVNGIVNNLAQQLHRKRA